MNHYFSFITYTDLYMYILYLNHFTLKAQEGLTKIILKYSPKNIMKAKELCLLPVYTFKTERSMAATHVCTFSWNNSSASSNVCACGKSMQQNI